jgi:signal transduction histidine kinase
VYAIFLAIVGVFIGLLDFSNQTLVENYPHFPQWILPAVSSIVAVSIGFFVWSKLRESDALKSEFITVVTHKFRTPLTQIRWATESLSPSLSEEDKNNVVEIERASSQLVDLTNLLVQLSDTDVVEYNYQMRPMRLDALVDDMKAEYERRAGLKEITIHFSGSPGRDIMADEAQTRFVVQTLLDNAISYTPKGGTISAQLREEGTGKKNGMVVFSVTDTGIGLSKEESGRIFEKFWRSSDARKADTEGMGIGLFMARRIAERQGGTLRTQSEGLGKGSTFSLRLPIKSNAAF